jgi:hypothetical protein
MQPIVTTIRLVFAVLAALLFFFAGIWPSPEPWRTRLTAAGLFFLTLAFFLFVQVH